MSQIPTRGALAPLAIAALVTLAGCTVAGVPIGAPQPYTDTGAALDGDALAADHTSALHDAGSFRSSTNLSVASGGDPVEVNRTVAVDGDRARASTSLDSTAVESDGLAVTTYTANDTTARRVVVDGDDSRVTHLDAAREPYDGGLLAVSPVDGDEQTEADLVRAATGEIDWTQRGVERYDDGWVTRYEASGPENVSDLGVVAAAAMTESDVERTGFTPADLDAESANATMLVSPDGVVRYLSMTVVGTTADGEAVRVTVTLTVDDVGATDVERPSWYDEATEDIDE